MFLKISQKSVPGSLCLIKILIQGAGFPVNFTKFLRVNSYFWINAIITGFFSICARKYYPRCKHRLSLQGRCNERRQYSQNRLKNSYYCICCSNMLKTYQIKSRLFEFLRNTKREELKINVTLQWLHIPLLSLGTGYVAF